MMIKNFPIKVGEEIRVSEYASTLTNNEEQLLITRDSKRIFLTDGLGNYSEINSKADIDLKPYKYNAILEYEGTKLVKETHTGDAPKIIEYLYDENDNVIKKTVTKDEVSVSAEYFYDEENRLINILDDGIEEIFLETNKSRSVPVTGQCIEIRQEHVFDITASEEEPHTLDFSVNATNKFDILPVNILRVKPGIQNDINMISDFLADDKDDFEDNECLKFGGNLSLINNKIITGTKLEGFENSSVFEYELDLSNFKEITSMEVI